MHESGHLSPAKGAFRFSPRRDIEGALVVGVVHLPSNVVFSAAQHEERPDELRTLDDPGLGDPMNENHRRTICSTFRHIDGRLAEIEAILDAVGSESPFSAYSLDIEPSARYSVKSYLRRLREKMRAAMETLQISQDGQRTSAAWAIRCAMVGVMVNLADIDPRRLGGYGELSAEAVTTIAGVCADLRRLSASLQAYLAQARGEDLAERLARLSGGSLGRQALQTLEGVIARNGLVELRPALEKLVARIESPDLEVAFFGRVNSGKSSLLNYLLGAEILPVGVLPVTAVLTRLRRAENAELLVRFEGSEPRRVPVDGISDYVTEEGNPGNERRVRDVEVRLPSPRLAEGVVFLDTPGVGSLATFGAAQTKAYLPRCDLGVLLVDAGSVLNEEDIALLRGFQEAFIPATVLISKCDLVEEADLERILDYARKAIRQELGGDIPIYPVSSRGPRAALADRWFRRDIDPNLQKHQDVVEASIRRKIAHLAEMAASYLEAMLGRPAPESAPAQTEEGAPAFEARLAAAASRIAAAEVRASRTVDTGLDEAIDKVIDEAAANVVRAARQGQERPGALVAPVLSALAERAHAVRKELEDLERFLEETLRTIFGTGGLPDGSSPEMGVEWTPLPGADERRIADLSEFRCSPGFVSFWPGLARRVVERRIRKRGYRALWSCLHEHRRHMTSWLGVNLDAISQAYESYVALFRDQLRVSGDGRPGPEHVARIRADLDLLREFRGIREPESMPGSRKKEAERSR